MPDDDEYRKQVQGKFQDLVSGRHKKSPSKLVIEAVVEGVKLYKSYKEEKAAEEEEEKAKGKRKHMRHRREGDMGGSRKDGRRGHGHSHGLSGRHRPRHHRSRSRDEERGRNDRSSQDQRHSRSRRIHRDESRRKRSRSQDRRSRARRRDGESGVRDPVTESPPNNDSEYHMTGGALPADKLYDGHRKPDVPLSGDGHRPGGGASSYQTSWQDLTTELRSQSQLKDCSRMRSRSPRRHNTPRPERKGSRTPQRTHRRSHRERSRSHGRDHAHNKQSSPRLGRADASRSPTRQQKGPDGTPFGSFPKYQSKAGIALGFGDHFMNTYRHIKAEHEAGYRTKGMFEKALDEARKKKTVPKGSGDKRQSGQARYRERTRKSEPERASWAEKYPGKTKGDEWKPRATKTEAWERHRCEEEEHRRSKPDSGRRKEDTDRKRDRSSPVPEIRVHPPALVGTRRRQPPPAAHEVSPPAPEPLSWQHTLQRSLPIREEENHGHEASPPQEPSVRGAHDKSDGGAVASYHNQAPRSPMPGNYEDHEEKEREDDHQSQAYDRLQYADTPPSPIVPPYPDAPPSPVGSGDRSGSSSPIMPHAPRASLLSPGFSPTFLQNIPMLAPPQSAPPAPLPSAARAPDNTGIAALLGDIQCDFKLRKLAASDKKDDSVNSRADRVAYDETAHSHEVEERERAQAREANNQSPVRANSTWSTVLSTDDEADARPEPTRGFQNNLLEQLKARQSGLGTKLPTTGPRRSSDDSSLTACSRTSMIANMSQKLQKEKAPFQRLSKSESGGDLMFTLAAHIAQPGWSFDGPETKC